MIAESDSHSYLFAMSSITDAVEAEDQGLTYGDIIGLLKESKNLDRLENFVSEEIDDSLMPKIIECRDNEISDSFNQMILNALNGKEGAYNRFQMAVRNHYSRNFATNAKTQLECVMSSDESDANTSQISAQSMDTSEPFKVVVTKYSQDKYGGSDRWPTYQEAAKRFINKLGIIKQINSDFNYVRYLFADKCGYQMPDGDMPSKVDNKTNFKTIADVMFRFLTDYFE